MYRSAELIMNEIDESERFWPGKLQLDNTSFYVDQQNKETEPEQMQDVANNRTVTMTVEAEEDGVSSRREVSIGRAGFTGPKTSAGRAGPHGLTAPKTTPLPHAGHRIAWTDTGDRAVRTHVAVNRANPDQSDQMEPGKFASAVLTLPRPRVPLWLCHVPGIVRWRKPAFTWPCVAAWL